MEAKAEKFYTYEDYCKFNDEKRREIINGVIYSLASPSKEHEEILVNLLTDFNTYLRDKKCKVYTSFDVRLPKKGETKNTASNVVRPDIFVVCDEKKLLRYGCVGAPDLVIEILSPSTGGIDKIKKFNLYQEQGVLEYWIVDPHAQTIDRFTLDVDTGKYHRAEIFSRDDAITPVIFPALTIKLAAVFPPLDEDEEEN